ncbi:protein FAR-RED IMPAIRED RESPONSE 1-like isoform X4 [Salvia divinorum]|uniref:Protein FAR-RED IMPAIRED RESPONSE 1-like isoform X4 n=1 Tax=Salvia divinorum TaxID=28513 RepID=A0ABD1H2X0_SALDI
MSDKLISCLSPDIDVLHFLKHFENAVNEQRYRELESTLDMESHAPVLMANAILLKHPKAFEVFQREYEKCLDVIIDKCGERRDTRTDYKTKTYGKSREFLVAYHSFDDTVSCNCMKFEHVGAAESDPAFEYASRQLDKVMRGIDRILNFKKFQEAKGTTEAESRVPDKDQLNHLGEQIPGVSGYLNICSSPPGTVLSVACAPPTYISSPNPAPSLSPLTQGLYTIESSHMVQSMYQASNLTINHQPNPNIYEPSSFYTNQHHSPSHARFLQESLIHSQFQDPMSNGNQLKQVDIAAKTVELLYLCAMAGFNPLLYYITWFSIPYWYQVSLPE